MESLTAKHKHRVYWWKTAFKYRNNTSSLQKTGNETQEQKHCRQRNKVYIINDDNELRKRICDDLLRKTNYHDTFTTIPKLTIRARHFQSNHTQVLDRRICTQSQFSLNSYCFRLFLLTTIILAHLLVINADTISSKKSSLLQQRFEMEPNDKTAIVGDTVILPCRVENKVGTLQWTRDGFGLGTERTLEGFQRYRMVGNDDEGDYSLEISQVTLEDDAVFQCQVGALDGVYGIRSRSASFTVQLPPKAPVIVVTHAHSHAQVVHSSGTASAPFSAISSATANSSLAGEMLVSAGSSLSSPSSSSSLMNDHHLRTTAGMTIELTCEAHGGRPPAELSWIDSSGNQITNGVSYSTTKLGDGKRWNAALKWTVVASRALDGARVSCRSENAALKGPRYAHIQLEVRYAPEVELRISSTPEDGIVRQGDDLTLECTAVGNPSRMTFKWSRDGVPLGAEGDVGASGDGTPRLVFRRVGREFHETIISCEVTNSVGTSRAKLEVKVAFKPRFLKPPEPVIGISKGERGKLECNIDSYPKATITWSQYTPKLNRGPNASDSRFTEHWRELGEGATIEIDSAGRYRCIGKSSVFDEELKSETLVFIKGAPLIRSSSVQYGIENEPVRLQCMVEAIPPPTKITWFKLKPFQKILGVDNNEGYEILEEEDPDDYFMPTSLSSSLSSSASYLTLPVASVADEESQQHFSSLALLRSIIYIRRAKESDFGQYNCSVWNQYGFQSQIITLQQQENMLSPLVLTLSGIIGTGVIFVLVASLVIFAYIRSQRLRQEHSLAPKKLDSDSGPRSGIGCPSGCNGSVGDGAVDDLEKKMNTLNLLEKNLVMKNTIMKMNDSNQVLITVANGTESAATYVGNGVLPVYSEYEYNYAYPSSDLVIGNGSVINNNPLPNYNYDNMATYSAHYDYAIHGNLTDDKIQSNVQMSNFTVEANNAHLYSTLMKANVDDKSRTKALLNSTSYYTSLLSTNTPTESSVSSRTVINVSNSQGNVCSNNNGLPSQPFASSTLTFASSASRPKVAQGPFVNEYMRTSKSKGMSASALPINHYSNVDSGNHRLSAGVYSAQQNIRYKLDSLGGASSSSGVFSTSGSSPGHSPVGSLSAN